MFRVDSTILKGMIEKNYLCYKYLKKKRQKIIYVIIFFGVFVVCLCVFSIFIKCLPTFIYRSSKVCVLNWSGFKSFLESRCEKKKKKNRNISRKK